MSDPSAKPEVQEALRWLAQECDWKPVLAWESMMCDVFPANLEPNRTFLPKPDILSRIQTMVERLRGLNIPIRISIGDRGNTCPSSGLDGSLYFGPFKTFVGEGADRREVLLPTQAVFSLTPIASMVDELTIQYPADVPGVSGWLRAAKRPTPAEKALMEREMIGWRRFWIRYALQFKNLKKLTANVPNDIYEDWANSEVVALLEDERWQMLEVEDKQDYASSSYFPFSNPSTLRYRFPRNRSKTKFVQRVFFRLDDEPLNLVLPRPELSEKEREEGEITDDMIQAAEYAHKASRGHRFWPKKEDDNNNNNHNHNKSNDKAEEKDAKRKWSDNDENGVNGESVAQEMEAKRQRIEQEDYAGFFHVM